MGKIIPFPNRRVVRPQRPAPIGLLPFRVALAVMDGWMAVMEAYTRAWCGTGCGVAATDRPAGRGEVKAKAKA